MLIPWNRAFLCTVFYRYFTVCNVTQIKRDSMQGQHSTHLQCCVMWEPLCARPRCSAWVWARAHSCAVYPNSGPGTDTIFKAFSECRKPLCGNNLQKLTLYLSVWRQNSCLLIFVFTLWASLIGVLTDDSNYSSGCQGCLGLETERDEKKIKFSLWNICK